MVSHLAVGCEALAIRVTSSLFPPNNHALTSITVTAAVVLVILFARVVIDVITRLARRHATMIVAINAYRVGNTIRRALHAARAAIRQRSLRVGAVGRVFIHAFALCQSARATVRTLTFRAHLRFIT